MQWIFKKEHISGEQDKLQRRSEMGFTSGDKDNKRCIKQKERWPSRGRGEALGPEEEDSRGGREGAMGATSSQMAPHWLSEDEDHSVRPGGEDRPGGQCKSCVFGKMLWEFSFGQMLTVGNWGLGEGMQEKSRSGRWRSQWGEAGEGQQVHGHHAKEPASLCLCGLLGVFPLDSIMVLV